MSESWQAQEKSKESVVSYVLSAREKLQEIAELMRNSWRKQRIIRSGGLTRMLD